MTKRSEQTLFLLRAKLFQVLNLALPNGKHVET
jgi:hypothetical protein